MAKGYTICKYCGDYIPTVMLKNHMNTVHKDVLKPLSVYERTLKTIIFLGAGMYLFGFGLWGTNVYGVIDALIPLERIFCFIFSGYCFSEFAVNFKKLIRQFREPVYVFNVGGGEKSKMRKILKNTKASSGVGMAVSIVGIVIGIYMFATLMPGALIDLFNQTWTGVPDGIQTLATTIVALVGVAAFVLVLIRRGD